MLVKCVDCGEKISENAWTCPRCGSSDPHFNMRSSQLKEEARERMWGWIILIGIAIALAIWGIDYIISKF